MAEVKNNIISLIGMTGCGKSSVGRILAKKIGARFIDLDDEISARFGEIKAIFADKGEEAFRKIEYEVLVDVIKNASGELTVLSCGGGVPTWEASRKHLTENTSVVWLRRSVESVTADENVMSRPPVNGDPENYRKLLKKRYPIYKKTAEYSFYNVFPQRTALAVINKLRLNKKEN